MKFDLRQSIDLGTMRALRSGAPSALSDIYYRVMEMRWPTFIAMVCAAFAGINLLFGLVYASFPGMIANAQPGSLVDGIFFSVDTLGTVGYGFMYPSSRIAHAIASIEILLGLFFSATVTGLIFARFARPKVGLAFSRCAVIGRHEGRPALMVRVVSMRSRALADADAQIACLQTIRHEDGRISRRLVELDLVRNRNPMLGLSWILVHVLPDDGVLRAALASEEHFLLTAMVRGTDTLLASPSIGSTSYARSDILQDREFADILNGEGDELALDMKMLSETIAI